MPIPSDTQAETLLPIQIESWLQYPWLRHAFSTRLGGVSTPYGSPSLNLGFTKEDDPAAVRENRRRLVQTIAPTATLVVPRQIHSAIVHTVLTPDSTQTPEGKATIEADCLITTLPNILLGIGTADCVPVLVADTRLRIVAAFHAGWRGTVARIVEQGIAQLRSTHNSNPSDLIAAIGPSIGACCYTVGAEVHAQFSAAFPYADSLFSNEPSSDPGTPHPGTPHPDTPHLDLWEANRRQLLHSGLDPSQITLVGLCTACTRDSNNLRRFFSHRDENGHAGRMLNVIGVTS
jgi:polyphenol oxidase